MLLLLSQGVGSSMLQQNDIGLRPSSEKDIEPFKFRLKQVQVKEQSKAGMHNSNLNRAQKFFLAYPRAKIDSFVRIQRVFFRANRLNEWHFGI